MRPKSIIDDGEYLPQLYAFGRGPILLDRAARALPHIQALLNDGRVIAALVHKEASVPPKPMPPAAHVTQPTPERPDPDTDTPTRTLIDDGLRSGIRVERFEWPVSGDAWLDFTIGKPPDKQPARVLAGVSISGAERPGMEQIIAGSCINEHLSEVWLLDDLRQLHADIGRLLADERFTGALAEQPMPTRRAT